MAFGGSPVIGLIGYAGVKIIGYSFAGKRLNQYYKKTLPLPFVFGLIRAAFGLAVGTSCLYLLSNITSNQEKLFLIFLIPVRFFEWFVIIYFFYERNKFSFKREAEYSILGIIWSFVLDIPALLSVFIIPGGVWVC